MQILTAVGIPIIIIGVLYLFTFKVGLGYIHLLRDIGAVFKGDLSRKAISFREEVIIACVMIALRLTIGSIAYIALAVLNIDASEIHTQFSKTLPQLVNMLVFAPIWEEYVFRLFPFTLGNAIAKLFKARLSPAVPVIALMLIGNVTWAYLHSNPFAIFILGLTFIYMMIRYGIRAAIIAHGMNNAVVSFIILMKLA